jgi:GDPmannose 4,6-dehydratase
VWKGKFEKEKAFWKDKSIIEIDKKYFRPTEVNSLKGNFSLAKKELNWKPKIHIKSLVKEMIEEELKNYSK